MRLACEQAGQPYGLQVPPRWMLKLMGAFVPVLRENEEMMYQFEHDYRFDSADVRCDWEEKPQANAISAIDWREVRRSAAARSRRFSITNR